MLRSIAKLNINFSNSTLICGVERINVPITQTVRWRSKKPKWLPPAKSKLFKIYERPTTPKDEAVEMKRLLDIYRTHRNSMKKYFEMLEEANQEKQNEENLEKLEKLEFERCEKINDEWNKEIALKREERLKKEWIKTEEFYSNRLSQIKAEETQQIAESEEYIRQLKQDATKFITRETLDQAIAEALENEVSYNVAIDTKGNKYTDIFERPGVTIKQSMAN